MTQTPKVDDIAAALITASGYVPQAARILGMSARDLRPMLATHPRLIDAALEVQEQALDEAERVLREGLKHPDIGKRLIAAGHIVKTNPAARRRGF